MKQIKIKQRNFVQEYSLLINHSTVFKDRKRAFKNGERKHKKSFDLMIWWDKHSSTSLLFFVIKILIRRLKIFFKK